MNFLSRNRSGQTELRPRRKAAIYLCLSFAIPFLIIMAALAGLQVAPFGDHTLVISDANGLYINTLSYAGRMLKGLEGFTYSFEKGLGGNMTGHLNGILLTPFAFLFSFADIANYPIAYTFVSALNMSLAGLTMYLLLADIYGHRRSNLIFSTSYALMGFQVANVFQAVFFSAAPVLPIMVLGLRRLLRGRNPIIYILSIAVGLALNAYFGFALCAASVCFFFTGLWYYEELRGRRVRIFGDYALSSACGGLLAAALWIPGFLSLRGGRLEQTGLTDFSMWENMPFLEIGAKLFTGANSTAELVDGLPNIFVGILPVVLVILFFLNKNGSKRKKTAAGILLGIYLLSFWIVAFNMVMHGGTTTNWFNYRYSYVFSLLLLLIAAEVWKDLEEVPLPDMKRGFAILVLATLVVFSKRYEFVQGGAVVLDLSILLVAYFAWLLHKKRPEQNPIRTYELVALLLVCVNLFLNYRICTKKIQEWETTLSDYQETIMVVEPLVEGVRASDPDFFRMEVNEQRSGTCGNDPMLYGYDGVGHGGSNERDFVRKALSRLGIPWFDMRNYYSEGVPAATDTLLGVKYVIAEEDLTEEKEYDKLLTLGDRSLYANPYALPVAFAARGDVYPVTTEAEDVFDNLNRVWQAVSGTEQQVFTEETEIRFEAHQLASGAPISGQEARSAVSLRDASLSAMESGSESDRGETPDGSTASGAEDSRTGATREPPEDSAYISYSWTARQDGPVYIYNRSGLSDANGAAASMVQYVGDYRAGETVTGYIPMNVDTIPDYMLEEVAGRFRAAYAENDTLQDLSKTVRAGNVTLRKEKETRLTGEAYLPEGGTILFTIPFDEGWHCYMDGQETALKEVFGVFMAAEAAPGDHTFRMVYEPAGARIGQIISAAALVLLLLYLPLGRKVLFGKAPEEAEASPMEAEADPQAVTEEQMAEETEAGPETEGENTEV